VKKESKIVKW